MIGMSFGSFLTLLVISVFVAFVVHYIARYRFVSSAAGFWGKLIVGWLGGWVGSPVFGYWWEQLKIADIYLAPALLGSLTAVFSTVLCCKTMATVMESRAKAETRLAEAERREREAA